VSALDEPDRTRHDVAIRDVLMPRMDGLTTCPRLRAGRRFQS
jgi:CheY-like chemotaxis protein